MINKGSRYQGLESYKSKGNKHEIFQTLVNSIIQPKHKPHGRKNKNRELEISDLWRQTEIQEKSAYLHYFPIGQYFIDPNYHCICNIFFLFKSFFHYFFSFVCFFNFCFKQVRIISMRKSQIKTPFSFYRSLRKRLSQKKYFDNRKEAEKEGEKRKREVEGRREKENNNELD